MVLIFGALGGCSVAPERPAVSSQPQDWESRKAQLEALQRWRVEGRVALKMGQEGGQSGFSWRQGAVQQQFNLSGLLGAGAVELSTTSEGAQLSTAGEHYRGARASDLLLSVTGWQIPVEQAQYWIRGVPAPQSEVQSLLLDGRDRLKQLQQAGWSIEVRRYQSVDGVELPAFVVLEQGAVRLKLRLTAWELEG